MSNGTDIKVVKRDGSTEHLNLEKVHAMTVEACEGLGSGVSASQIEMTVSDAAGNITVDDDGKLKAIVSQQTK